MLRFRRACGVLLLTVAFLVGSQGTTIGAQATAATGGGLSAGVVSHRTSVTGTLPPVHHGVEDQTSASDWPTYLGNDARTGYDASEQSITPETVSNLAPNWVASAGGGTATQPIVANGLIYMGSWSGYERAMYPSGQVAWSFFVGTASQTCEPYTVGVVASPTVATETVGGSSLSVLYIVSVTGVVYALNASTGAELWQTTITGYQSGWASPLVYNGEVYVGFCGARGASNQLAELDAGTGALEHQFFTSAYGSICSGPGIWGSPTVDEATGVIYVATADANANNCNLTWDESVIALDASSLSVIGSWQIPLAQQSNDTDFGSTPTLFSAPVNGSTEELVGVASKNGMFYALDAADLAAGPVWSERVAMEGNEPDIYGEGSISPAAFDGTNLYVAGGVTSIGADTCPGGVRALNPANGAVIWQTCLSGAVLGAVTAVPGVVFVGAGSVFTALSAATGQILWHWAVSGGQPIYGAPTVSNGVLYAADMNGNMYAFSTPGGASVFPAPVSPCATTVPVAVQGMAPGEAVNLYLDSTSSPPLASATAGPDGSAYTSVPVTAGPGGSHTLIAVGQTSGTTASHSFPTVASICLAQSQGPQGTLETVTGAGFAPNEHLTIYFGTGPPPQVGTASGGKTVGQVTVGSGGAFQGRTAVTFRVPASPYAPLFVEAVGNQGAVGNATFLITAAVRGSLTSGPAGTVVHLSGVDFNPQWTVTSTGNSAPVSCGAATLLGTGTTNPSGQFTGLAVTIPDVPAGGYVITVTGTAGTSTTFQFTVTGG